MSRGCYRELLRSAVTACERRRRGGGHAPVKIDVDAFRPVAKLARSARRRAGAVGPLTLCQKGTSGRVAVRYRSFNPLHLLALTYHGRCFALRPFRSVSERPRHGKVPIEGYNQKVEYGSVAGEVVEGEPRVADVPPERPVAHDRRDRKKGHWYETDYEIGNCKTGKEKENGKVSAFPKPQQEGDSFRETNAR